MKNQQNNKILNYSILILFASVLLIFFICFFENNKQFVYSFDDAYIHMAMAKNFALHGVWGVTQHEFTSSSSSLLWTFLLAAIYFVFTPNTIASLVLNFLFSVLLLISVYLILKKKYVHNRYIFIILLLMFFLLPLIPLIFTGLEHVLHVWVSILFVYFISQSICCKKKHTFINILLAMLIPLIRYEGIVLVFAGIFLLLLNKRYILSSAMFIGSSLPVFFFGLLSVSKGWSFFPNSLVLKGGFPDIVSPGDFTVFLMHLTNRFLDKPYVVVSFLLVLIFAGILLYFSYRKRKSNFVKSSGFIMLILLFVNVVLYIIYAGSGWSYRYQSFLIALGIFVFSFLIAENKDWIDKIRGTVKYFVIIIAVSLFVLYFWFQGAVLIFNTPVAMKNIYEQQYQMGKFIEMFYNGRAVALNDIGTTNYFADIKCIDLWGLSNIEVSQKLRNGSYGEKSIRDITVKHDVLIAILYDSWFSEGDSTILPKEWVKAGEWQIQNNIIAGDDVVSFYAVKPDEEINLIKNLKLYSGFLPAGVRQSGIYINK